MVKIKFGEEMYNLPTSWDEVTINQFQQVKKLDFKEEGKLKYIIKLVQIFTGLPEELIINADANALNKIYEVISFIYTTSVVNNEMTYKFEIGKDKYELKEFNNLTVGERISLEVLLEDNEVDDMLPEIMAILFKRNDEPFDASKINDIADDIATEVSISKLYGVMLFFCEVEKILLSRIQIYSEEQKEIQKMKEMTKTMRMIYKTKMKMKQILGYIGTNLSKRWQMGSSWTKRRFIKQTL